MTNVYATPDKVLTKSRLFDAGVKALQDAGWTVERVAKGGKASLRRITKGNESKLVSIRTTQDTWIAFPRDKMDSKWVTLSDVDLVAAVSVDDPETPQFAQIHLLDADDVRARFDRAYAARIEAGYKIPVGRGVWVSLYHPEGNDPVTHVGAGAGLASAPIAKVALASQKSLAQQEPVQMHDGALEEGLTIPEAKRRLALTFGIDPDNVKITIEV